MNQIQVIQPYYFAGTWVFDDPATDLVQEPFVEGMPQMIDALLERTGLPHRQPFRLLFSHAPFPGYAAKLDWVREEYDGNWYEWPTEPEAMVGWLCPALFKYFDQAPRSLYVKPEAIEP